MTAKIVPNPDRLKSNDIHHPRSRNQYVDVNVKYIDVFVFLNNNSVWNKEEDMMSADKFSAVKLNEFWEYVIEKGLMNKQTAISRKTASQKVLELLDESERQDLRALDREHAFVRFQNIAGKRYSPSSLTVYRSRFNASLDDFLSYAANPSGFKSNTTKSNGKVRGEGTKQNAKRVAASAEKESSSTQSTLDLSPSSDNLTLPIPLRPGVVVKIFGLPSDLSEDEAKKISGVVSAYAYPVKGSE